MKKSLFAIAVALFSLTAVAQPYPNRPVRIVVPLSPGGFADTPARLLAPRLSEQMGRQFFIENRPGAGGTIGADFVAKSAPDGYTLLFTGTPHVIGAHLYKKLPYDALKDFTPIAMVASGPYALVVNPQKVPVDSVRELIATAKAQPGKIDYASSGNGSAQHLVGALFNSLAGIELNHVPYKGSGPAMQDLVAGQVGVSFAGIPNVLSHVKAGRVKVLGVTTSRRWSELPDVPTLAEAGVPGYEATLWLNVSGPANLPADIVQRLHAEIGKALQDKEVQAQFRSAGVDPSALSTQELGAFIRAEYDKWGKVVRDTGATVN
ncbi:MAG TPA: tripartite tricarboxylate transporter substrate binding protein [Burkholderiales bacterium]|nr:tripartite tricarboxylate transporter substrate binding protein [Burkholderiales bacterium]